MCDWVQKEALPRGSVPSGEPLAYSGRRLRIKFWALFCGGECLGWGAFVIFSLQGKEGGAGKQKRGQRNRYPLKMGIKKGTLSLIGQCAVKKIRLPLIKRSIF